MKKELILLGGGGHCHACIDVVEAEGKFEIAGVVDMATKVGQSVLDYKIIASDDELPRLVEQYSYFLITLGQIKTPSRRIALFEQVKQLGGHFPVIASPRAYVSSHASVGEGTIVMHDALVNAATQVGRNCIVNTKTLIEHDVQIGDCCHIATSAVINGGVHLGERTFVGSNCVLRESIKVGSGSLIAAGAVVMHSLAENSFFTNLRLKS
jgi:sugar O-acyltransferase (sialic acid O-acetyltransferase NeuD family)